MSTETDNDEADEIVGRIEELEILQDALQRISETLALFLKPAQPIKPKVMQPT